MIKDYLKIAFENLRNRQLRSYLTALGIVISVASIVALIAISNGLQFAIHEQFEKIGTNRIFVMMGGGTPGTVAGLTTDDVETLEKLPDFEYVTPYVMEQSAKITFSKEDTYMIVTGWPTDDAEKRTEDYDFNFIEGKFAREGEKYGAVVGYLHSTGDIFKKEVHVGNNIYVNDVKFKVVGVMDEIGNSQDDSNVLIPLETAREIFHKPTEVDAIDAEVKEGKDLDAVVEKTKKALERQRGDDYFEIMTPTQMLKFLNDILGIVQGVLVSIALISLIVGAVGIMNSMYTAVLERTKEIGVMKSIGATNFNIMSLFLVEAGLIGLAGGILGVLLGLLIAFGVGQAAAAGGFSLLKIRFEVSLVVVGILFAVIVGMFSGALPSYRASKLSPVDALRWVK